MSHSDEWIECLNFLLIQHDQIYELINMQYYMKASDFTLDGVSLPLTYKFVY